MEKGSISDSRLRWFDEVVDVGVRCQKLFFSVGDGYDHMSVDYSDCGIDKSHWKVDPAVVDRCRALSERAPSGRETGPAGIVVAAMTDSSFCTRLAGLERP